MDSFFFALPVAFLSSKDFGVGDSMKAWYGTDLFCRGSDWSILSWKPLRSLGDLDQNLCIRVLLRLLVAMIHASAYILDKSEIIPLVYI